MHLAPKLRRVGLAVKHHGVGARGQPRQFELGPRRVAGLVRRQVDQFDRSSPGLRAWFERNLHLVHRLEPASNQSEVAVLPDVIAIQNEPWLGSTNPERRSAVTCAGLPRRIDRMRP